MQQLGRNLIAHGGVDERRQQRIAKFAAQRRVELRAPVLQRDAALRSGRGAVGQVVASASEALPEGTWVVHDLGWREAALVDAARARLFDASAAPLSTALGVLGMPGLTAFVGINFLHFAVLIFDTMKLTFGKPENAAVWNTLLTTSA